MAQMGDSVPTERFTHFCNALFEWYNTEAKVVEANPGFMPDRFKLALGCVVFGQAYLERFLNYCVPSLRAAGNLPAIAGTPIWIIIHTDAASVSRLKSDVGLLALADVGVCLEIKIIPQKILKMVPEEVENKYWLLGAVNNLQIQQAKFKGYGFSMLMPDLVYSENYFSTVRKLAMTNDAIVQCAISSRFEDVRKKLKNNGVLAMDARKLNAIALDNLHRTYLPYVMNGKDYEKECPMHNFMVFMSDNAVHIMSPHSTPVYISHSLLLNCEARLFNTIDSQLPFFISESAKVYVPQPRDNMCYIEMSDDNKHYHETGTQDLLNYCIRFWMLTYCEDVFLRYVGMNNVFMLPDYYIMPFKPMKVREIKSVKSNVMAAIVKYKEVIKSCLDEKYRKDPLPRRAA